ncbi:MAG: saccharopine dehydrogenase NADP-binding domain-containing protein [Cyclobacteriaceae bacterium]|nr:saccharopine dehydrogenase NADP-binding domain-containing protein [Cyclobacteriaceae bacterium]
MKKHILVLGAGRSSSALISYLFNQTKENDWTITVGDISKPMAAERMAGQVSGCAIEFNIEDQESSRRAIASADVVISLMPAHLHVKAARICLTEKKHFLTASYVSDEMKSLDTEATSKSLLFLNECGLDPGIDHMSGLQVMDRIKSTGGKITSFESFTGGLIAPETDPENPWRYKFTWNPRNVVMAGQGTAKFLEHGQYKFIPYQQLFLRTNEISVPGYGEFEGYGNRDSLKYMETYGLRGIETMLRGTLRNKGFCSAWNILVQMGCCEDTYQMEQVGIMTHRDFFNSFLRFHPTESIEEKIASVFKLSLQGEEMKKFRWSGFFTDELVGLASGTPAQILEHILHKKWKLKSADKDLIVMWHRFLYSHNGIQKEVQAYLTATGENETTTAMAKTVGLPLGIATKLLLQEKIKSRGVVIPVAKEFYDPILKELKSLGISLVEREIC